MKTNITEQIEKLQSELDRLKELNSQGEPKKGEWWWADCFNTKDYLMLVKYTPNLEASCYFIPSFKEFVTIFGNFDALTRKATDKEVCDAFKKYLDANGWTKGCRFKSAVSGLIYDYTGVIEMVNGNIIDGNGVIFNPDILTLAELVKEEKIMVGENEVMFFKDYIKIGDWAFNKHRIKDLIPANPELFGKILKRMESSS